MTLAENYDALLLDLDGTVWSGGEAIPGAVEAVKASGVADYYVTNNASRSAGTVAGMLAAIGLDVDAQRVVTSAQAAVELAAERLPAGSKVLVLGANTLRELAADSGLEVVDSADAHPDAVVHGHDPDTGWRQLSEAALAIRAGATYIATNLDTTLPMQRGLMVGNGSMVAAVVSATGVRPVSAGKPEPAMFHVAARHAAARRPLAVGDRLNTDIQGGNAADMDTLQVLTGVSGAADLLTAGAELRPTFIAADMSGLFAEPEQLSVGPQGGFTAHVEGSRVIVSGGHRDADSLQALRTALAAAWDAADSARADAASTATPVTEAVGEGPVARAAIAGWHW